MYKVLRTCLSHTKCKIHISWYNFFFEQGENLFGLCRRSGKADVAVRVDMGLVMKGPTQKA